MNRDKECEIEITPAMIEAGEEELERGYFGDGRYNLTSERLVAIYCAMNAARLSSPRNC